MFSWGERFDFVSQLLGRQPLGQKTVGSSGRWHSLIIVKLEASNTRAVPIVLVKCWKVTYWNAKMLLKNCPKSKLTLLPKFKSCYVKCWKVTYWNAKMLLKNCPKSKLTLLPKFQKLLCKFLDILNLSVNFKLYSSFYSMTVYFGQDK